MGPVPVLVPLPQAALRLEWGLTGSPEQAVVPTSWVWEHRVLSMSLRLWLLPWPHVPQWVQPASVRKKKQGPLKEDAGAGTGGWVKQERRVFPLCARGEGKWIQGGVHLGQSGAQASNQKGDGDMLRGRHMSHHTQTHTWSCMQPHGAGGGCYTIPCLGPQMPLHSHPYAVAQSFPYTRRQAVSHTHSTPSTSAVTPAHAHMGTHTTKSHMPPCSTGRPGLGHHPQWHP